MHFTPGMIVFELHGLTGDLSGSRDRRVIGLPHSADAEASVRGKINRKRHVKNCRVEVTVLDGDRPGSRHGLFSSRVVEPARQDDRSEIVAVKA